MHAQIFVNLPIDNMARSQAFFRALGYEFNPQFTNDQGACLVVGENLFVMLLVKSFYQTFTDKTIADARTTSEVLVCLSCSSREEVDALVDKAVAAGATTPRPAQDLAVSLETLLDLEGDLAGLEHKGGAPGLGVGRVDARDADRPQQQRDEQGDQGGGDDALEHALGYVVAERLHLGSLVSAEKSGPGVPEAWWKMPVKPLRQDRRPD